MNNGVGDGIPMFEFRRGGGKQGLENSPARRVCGDHGLNSAGDHEAEGAFPEAVNNAVHTAGVYASRGTNPLRNQSNGIFADSLASELVTPTGNPSAGYVAAFQIALAA
jgi:hypothetical protein